MLLSTSSMVLYKWNPTLLLLCWNNGNLLHIFGHVVLTSKCHAVTKPGHGWHYEETCREDKSDGAENEALTRDMVHQVGIITEIGRLSL